MTIWLREEPQTPSLTLVTVKLLSRVGVTWADLVTKLGQGQPEDHSQVDSNPSVEAYSIASRAETEHRFSASGAGMAETGAGLAKRFPY